MAELHAPEEVLEARGKAKMFSVLLEPVGDWGEDAKVAHDPEQGAHHVPRVRPQFEMQ